jgi:hypothetical protein
MGKSNVSREVIEGLTRTNKDGKTLRVFKVTKGGRGRPSIMVEKSKGHYELLRVFDAKMKPKGKRGRPTKEEVARRQAERDAAGTPEVAPEKTTAESQAQADAERDMANEAAE